MTTTTKDDITTEQIEALRTEAGAAGDRETVRYCDLALEGGDDADAATEVCVTIIANAEADRAYAESLDEDSPGRRSGPHSSRARNDTYTVRCDDCGAERDVVSRPEVDEVLRAKARWYPTLAEVEEAIKEIDGKPPASTLQAAQERETDRANHLHTLVRIELGTDPHPCGQMRWARVRENGHIVAGARAMVGERSDEQLVQGAISAHREGRARIRETLRRFLHPPRICWYRTEARRRREEQGYPVDPDNPIPCPRTIQSPTDVTYTLTAEDVR